MQKDEAIKILARHLMQCGMLMPIEWVQKNGEDSEFMEAYKMAMDALKNDPVRCKGCKHYYYSAFRMSCVCDFDNKEWDKDDFCSYGERREGE